MSEERRDLTMREAGRLGGEATLARHGVEHYHRIGRKGGQRLRELLARGREEEARVREGRG